MHTHTCTHTHTNCQAQSGLTNTLPSAHSSLGEYIEIQVAFLATCPEPLWDRFRPQGHVSGSALSVPMNRTQERRLLLYCTSQQTYSERGQSHRLPSFPLLLFLISPSNRHYIKAGSRQVCVGGCPPFPGHLLLLTLLSGSQRTGRSGEPAPMSEQEKAEEDNKERQEPAPRQE